jgi:hypothetical protein
MITVSGGSKGQRNYTFDLATFVCRKYNVFPDIDIAISRTDRGSLGGIIQADDSEYEIDIQRNLPLRDFCITLAHELIHMTQYEQGTLTQTNEKGIPYWDKPSEIAAHQQETVLFEEWINVNNLNKLKWTQSNVT